MLNVNKAIEVVRKHDGFNGNDSKMLRNAISEAKSAIFSLQKLDSRAPESKNKKLLISALEAVRQMITAADGFCDEITDLMN